MTYEVLRSADLVFLTGACLPSSDPSAATASDPDIPPPGGIYRYLVRAVNGCPGSGWDLGVDSAGAPRAGPSCP